MIRMMKLFAITMVANLLLASGLAEARTEPFRSSEAIHEPRIVYPPPPPPPKQDGKKSVEQFSIPLLCPDLKRCKAPPLNHDVKKSEPSLRPVPEPPITPTYPSPPHPPTQDGKEPVEQVYRPPIFPTEPIPPPPPKQDEKKSVQQFPIPPICLPGGKDCGYPPPNKDAKN